MSDKLAWPDLLPKRATIAIMAVALVVLTYLAQKGILPTLNLVEPKPSPQEECTTCKMVTLSPPDEPDNIRQSHIDFPSEWRAD